MSTRPTMLPPLYYRDHFTEMVGFVVAMYENALGPEERDFLADYASLDQPTQCLLIRISNRKRPIFRKNDLRYQEIPDTGYCLNALAAGGWIRPILEDDYHDLLSTMSKETLCATARRCDLDIKSSWSKPRLTAFIQQNLPFSRFQEAVDTDEFFVPSRAHEVGFLFYLYFGKLNDGLTVLALRDLGIATTNTRESFSAKFRDLAEAKAGYAYNQAIQRVKKLKTEALAFYTKAYVEAMPIAETPYTAQLRESFLFMLGGLHEKMKDVDAALGVYRLSNAFECRERIVRLLWRKDEKHSAATMLEDMVSSPSSDEEFHFATDFLARKFGKQKTSIYTEMLRGGTAISIDEFYRGSPEQAAIRHYKKQGWAGGHVENFIWNTVFGLIFWEELFEQHGAMTSAFDWIPHSLTTRQFHVDYEREIAEKLNMVRDGGVLEEVARTYETRNDTPNGIFAWFDGLKELVEQFISYAPRNALATMLEKMCHDYHSTCDGFPDLLLIKGDQFRFVEIKAEGDQVRRHQLVRFMQLKSCGFDVEICRVNYHVDPEQIYVVVDVETTGGRPPNDRVTEIGAVKVQNGEIIGEWQSLINPERHIPAMITSLTGISNAMVAEAPLFSEVAEEFLEFLDGAVFVAHNVNFDYGFIASEFRRLDLPFKFPKLCTCSSMRTHFPGLDSYSLGNLCDVYGIDLDNHHRALCDAKAAAGLLKKINAKRMDRQTLKVAA